MYFRWIGVGFVTTSGTVYIPHKKALKALGQVQTALEGNLRLQEYRKLLGRLENFCFVLSKKRDSMFGLWHLDGTGTHA